MTTLATERRFSIPGFVELPCWKCNTVILVHEHSAETPVCPQCEREIAESAFWELKSHLTNLRTGKEEFAAWTPLERREHLSELILGDDGHCCFEAPARAAQVTRELAEGVKFEQPSLADLDAMADTIEMAELVEA